MKEVIIKEATIDKVVRQRKKDFAKVDLQIPIDDSIKIPLGSVKITIEKTQIEMFEEKDKS